MLPHKMGSVTAVYITYLGSLHHRREGQLPMVCLHHLERGRQTRTGTLTITQKWLCPGPVSNWGLQRQGWVLEWEASVSYRADKKVPVPTDASSLV